MWSEVLIRAYWLSTDHLTFYDQKFLLEPINSPIDQPTSCKQVLLSELRNSQRYFNWICFAFVYKEGPISRYFAREQRLLFILLSIFDYISQNHFLLGFLSNFCHGDSEPTNWNYPTLSNNQLHYPSKFLVICLSISGYIAESSKSP